MWRSLFDFDSEYDPGNFSALRRVIMAGYYHESGRYRPKVGEAFWGDPDARGARWIWASGSDVINALAYQDLPDFPIGSENDQYVVGRPVKSD